MRTPAPILFFVATLSVGCTSKTPTVTNPFNTADRVPPPTLRAGEGISAPTYYPGAAAPAWPATPSISPAPASPGFQQPAPTFQQPAPGFQPGPAPPPAAPSSLPGSATPIYGAPPLGGSASRSRPQRTTVAAGESIAIPSDSGSLRFATQAESSFARNESQPLTRAAVAQVASAPTRRPATASGWIAGSAPVRPTTPAIAPRVRMPAGEFTREPVSLAAIGGERGVPLEPVPNGRAPGEPAPLRVASPPASTGWR